MKKFVALITFLLILLSVCMAYAEEEFKTLESMGGYNINEYIEFYVPNDFQLLDAETKAKKYITLTDQPVLTNGKVDIVIHLDENKLKNKKSEVEAARNAITKNLSAAFPSIDYDTSVTLKIGKKYMSLIRFYTNIEDRLEYTIVSVFEVNGQTMVITYKISDDFFKSQDTFFIILKNIKFK